MRKNHALSPLPGTDNYYAAKLANHPRNLSVILLNL